MGIKVRHSGLNPKKLKSLIHQRIQKAGSEAGRAISEGLKEEVLKRIPRGEKWLEIYRDSLTFLENKSGTSWAIAGVAPIQLTTAPAESTQIRFTGNDPVAAILKKYIWTVDTLPAISGGYKADVIVRPASKSEMEAHREKLARALPEVRKQLQEAGAQIIDEFPVVLGKKLLDLRFLQLRLEHGLGGFKRIPHFKPASRKVKNDAKKMVGGRKGKIQQILAGGEGSDAEVMSDSLNKLLKQWRADAWNP